MEKPSPVHETEKLNQFKESANQVLQAAGQKVRKIDLNRFKDFLRKSKKTIVRCMIAFVIVCIAFAAFSLLTNNYYTPIRTMQKYENKEEYSFAKAALDYSNGLVTSEMKKIAKIISKSDSDDLLDMMELMEESRIEAYEEKLDTYGEDYKVTYTEIAKTELSKSELRDYRSDLRDMVGYLEQVVEEAEDYDSEDWGYIADELGLTKADTRELVKYMGDMAEEFGRLEVTKGYEVELERTVTGSELDEPEVEDVTVYVLKINGRWVSVSGFESIFYFWDLMG